MEREQQNEKEIAVQSNENADAGYELIKEIPSIH